MRWIGSNHLSTDLNVVDVEPKGITGVAVQCNLSVGVVQIVDLCMLVESLIFVYVLFNVLNFWGSMNSVVQNILPFEHYLFVGFNVTTKP